MSNEIQCHERYKQYAYNAYHLGDVKFPTGTKVLGVATSRLGLLIQRNLN